MNIIKTVTSVLFLAMVYPFSFGEIDEYTDGAEEPEELIELRIVGVVHSVTNYEPSLNTAGSFSKGSHFECSIVMDPNAVMQGESNNYSQSASSTGTWSLAVGSAEMVEYGVRYLANLDNFLSESGQDSITYQTQFGSLQDSEYSYTADPFTSFSGLPEGLEPFRALVLFMGASDALGKGHLYHVFNENTLEAMWDRRFYIDLRASSGYKYTSLQDVHPYTPPKGPDGELYPNPEIPYIYENIVVSIEGRITGFEMGPYPLEPYGDLEIKSGSGDHSKNRKSLIKKNITRLRF